MTRASATWNRALLWAMLVICLAIATTASTQSLSDQTRWWKGNLHSHTFWSDGDDFPEMVAELYKNHGYDFLALSDHNRLSQGQRWMVVTEAKKATFDRYVARFGRQWVQTRTNDEGQTLVRLKPLTEFRGLFEEPGRFLLIQSEEITEKAHLNAINVIDVIRPQGGDTLTEIMQNDVDAVHAQAERTGQAMLVFINHPNFVWALTAEDIIPVKNARFFELNIKFERIKSQFLTCTQCFVTFWTDANHSKGQWIGWWTVFYWIWWISWGPGGHSWYTIRHMHSLPEGTASGSARWTR